MSLMGGGAVSGVGDGCASCALTAGAYTQTINNKTQKYRFFDHEDRHLISRLVLLHALTQLNLPSQRR